MSEVKIARIRRATLGWEDHGILSCLIDFDYGSGGQGIGGYALDQPVHDDDGRFVGRRGTAYGMQFVERVMRACGVEDWSRVEGRTVLAIREGDDFHAPIVGIAPLPTEPGERFIFADLAAEHFPERDSEGSVERWGGMSC